MNTLTLLAATQAHAQEVATNLIWLALLIVGYALVIVEVYLPGFGFPGILGGVCLIAGVALRARGDIMTWLVMTLIVAAILCVVLSITLRSAAKGRLGKSKFVLKEVATNEVSESDLAFYVGKTGTATTILRPAGNAEFDGVKLNVTSDGEFIPEGANVIGTRVEGNRIMVRKA